MSDSSKQGVTPNPEVQQTPVASVGPGLAQPKSATPATIAPPQQTAESSSTRAPDSRTPERRRKRKSVSISKGTLVAIVSCLFMAVLVSLYFIESAEMVRRINHLERENERLQEMAEEDADLEALVEQRKRAILEAIERRKGKPLCHLGFNFQRVDAATNADFGDQCYCEKEIDPADMALALEELYQLQHPRTPDGKCDCKNGRYFLHHLWEGNGNGIGSHFHILVPAMAVAYMTNRTLILKDTKWIFATGGPCEKEDYTCYFEPISCCTEQQVLEHEPPGSQIPIYDPNDTSQVNRRVINGGGYQGVFNENGREVPPAWAQYAHTVFWNAVVKRYFMRLKPRVLQRIEDERKKLGLDDGEPYMHIHVRAGSKHTEARLVSLEEYMPRAKALANKYGLRKILLATEDNKAIEATKKYPEFKWIWTDYPRNNTEPLIGMVQGTVNPYNETMNSLVNLYLGAQADALMVTFSSNWGKLLYETAISMGHNVPTVSMDAEWGNPVWWGPSVSPCCPVQQHCFPWGGGVHTPEDQELREWLRKQEHYIGKHIYKNPGTF